MVSICCLHTRFSTLLSCLHICCILLTSSIILLLTPIMASKLQQFRARKALEHATQHSTAAGVQAVGKIAWPSHFTEPTKTQLDAIEKLWEA